MRLFYTNGFVASTVREIAQACELTPGAIYNHFGSKHDILYSIIELSHVEAERDVEAAISAAGDGSRERLRAALVAFVYRHTAFPEAARVTNRDYVFLPEPRRGEVVARRRQLRARFQELIEEGIAEGVMQIPRAAGRRGLAAELTAMSIINMCVMVAEWYRPGGPLSAGAVSEFEAALGLQLVAAEGP